MYKFIYPKNWNEIKFKLNKSDTIVYSGTLPDFVKDFLDKVGFTYFAYSEDKEIPFDETDLNTLIFADTEETTEEGAPVSKIDYEAMFTDWSECEDLKTLYIEANASNVCTSVNMYASYLKRPRTKVLKELGYDVKLLIWKHDIPLMTEEQINLLEKNTDFEAEIIEFDETFKYPRISLAKDAVDIIENKKVIHIISEGNEVEPYYRRAKLNTALKEKYGIENVGTNIFLGTCNLCVVSHPVDVLPIADRYIYDRTDNWNALSEGDENTIMDKASVITCSSYWLYEDTLKYIKENRKDDDVKVVYVPNGNELYDYPENVTKFERKSAIYIGNRLQKVDTQLIYLLCDLYPQWDFYIYAFNATALSNPPENLHTYEMVEMEELFPILCKCHIGLIPLKTSNWTQGMLSNKLFSYINARIPTVHFGVPNLNYKDYEGKVAFNLNSLDSLDVIADKEISKETYESFNRSWKDVTSEIIANFF